jgi:hypothetical protein
MCRGEPKASANAISAAAYPLHSTVAAHAAPGWRSRGSRAAKTCGAAPTATPNADQTGGEAGHQSGGEHELRHQRGEEPAEDPPRRGSCTGGRTVPT